jgi:hypothetical protein
VHGIVFKPMRRHKCKGKDKEQKIIDDQPLKIKLVWKRISILWDLPYWQYLSVQHSIDVMHVQKNVCESIIGTLLNMKDKTKDSLKARLEATKLGGGITLEVTQGKPPPVSYVCTKKEAKGLCDSLYGMYFPMGYATSMQRIVSKTEHKLTCMKSHDIHVLMTQTLPVAIRNILTPHV